MPNATVKLHLRGVTGKPLECDVSAEAGIVEAVSGTRRVRVEGVRVGARIQAVGQERFLNGVQAKYRDVAAQGRNYMRALAAKVKF